MGLPGSVVTPGLAAIRGQAVAALLTADQDTRSSGAGTLRRAPSQVGTPPGPALDLAPNAEPTSPLPADPASTEPVTAGATAGTSHSLIPSAWPETSTPATAVAAPASAAPVDAELAAARGRLLELAAQRPPDMDDPAALDELASLLYPRLHREIRLELLIDRERSGLLSDFR